MNKRRFETIIHQSSKVLLLQGKLQTISLVLKTCKKDVQRRKWFEGKKNRFSKLFLKGSAIGEIPVILISTLLVPVIDIDAHVLGGWCRGIPVSSEGHRVIQWLGSSNVVKRSCLAKCHVYCAIKGRIFVFFRQKVKDLFSSGSTRYRKLRVTSPLVVKTSPATTVFLCPSLHQITSRMRMRSC